MNYPNYSTNPLYSPVPLWAFIIGAIGAFVLIFSFLYGLIKVIQTKDTSPMSLTMWIITTTGALCLTIFFALGIGLSKGQSLSFILMFCFESISLMLATIVMIIKIKNIIKAKQNNISEKEYCKLLYEKLLAKKNTRSE